MGCCHSRNSGGVDNAIVMSKNPYNSMAYPSIEEMIKKNLSQTEGYIPKLTRGFVAKVYDGDSITILSYNEDIPESKKVYKYSVRLNSIDCPEIRTKDETEKQFGQRAQKRLADLILHKYVRIKVLKFEKYGRLLAEVYVETLPEAKAKKYGSVTISLDMSVSEWIMRNRYGVPYGGATKQKFNSARLAPLDM